MVEKTISDFQAEMNKALDEINEVVNSPIERVEAIGKGSLIFKQPINKYKVVIECRYAVIKLSEFKRQVKVTYIYRDVRGNNTFEGNVMEWDRLYSVLRGDITVLNIEDKGQL